MSDVKRWMLTNLAILAGWLLFALAMGIFAHGFRAWRLPSAYYVLALPDFSYDYVRVAGPYSDAQLERCRGEARRLGEKAECRRELEARADGFVKMSPAEVRPYLVTSIRPGIGR